MYVFPKLRSFLLVALSLVLGVCASDARSVYIQDNGGFFSDSAKAEATNSIAAMDRKLHKDVVVETFASLPADLQKGVNLGEKASVAKVVQQWALKQMKAHDVNGVYILLVKSPSHLQIEIGQDTQQRAFTLADRTSLTSLMLNDLRAGQNDSALLNGVNFVASTMLAHEPTNLRSGYVHPSNPSSPRGHSWGLLPIILCLIVVWIVFRLIGALFRGGGGGMMTGTGYSGGPMGGPMMGGGGGGGFFSSMLGGIFGAAAGNWMYDRFFGRGDAPTYDSQPEVRQADDGGYTGKDTYENFNDTSGGGGGDFGNGNSGSDTSGGSGDSGSSGDSGGGDFGGGGDSGGGDSGGGGDF